RVQVGAVIYEMVTGSPPFRGRNRMELLHAVMTQRPRPLAELSPAAPSRLQAILDGALAKSPGDRFPTMAVMGDQLKGLMRPLSPEAGVVPTELSAPLLAPRHARSSWLLSGTLGRMFSRRRTGPASARVAQARPTPTTRRGPAWDSQTTKAIAVLPFKNLSGDPEAQFYEVSLADAIITELAHLRAVVV